MIFVLFYVLFAVDLHNNLLIGSIPAGIGTLSNLKWLQFQDNGLTGTVPNSFANLQNLEILWLQNNKLSGALPDMFDTMSSLDWLVISNNELSGRLPDSLGNISSLWFVDLSNNPFTGSIPDSFCTLDGTGISMRGTNINGTIPDECCGSIVLIRDNNWFVEDTIECSCCDDAVECYMWSIDDVVEDVTNHPPCPTKNIYSFDY